MVTTGAVPLPSGNGDPFIAAFDQEQIGIGGNVVNVCSVPEIQRTCSASTCVAFPSPMTSRRSFVCLIAVAGSQLGCRRTPRQRKSGRWCRWHPGRISLRGIAEPESGRPRRCGSRPVRQESRCGRRRNLLFRRGSKSRRASLDRRYLPSKNSPSDDDGSSANRPPPEFAKILRRHLIRLPRDRRMSSMCPFVRTRSGRPSSSPSRNCVPQPSGVNVASCSPAWRVISTNRPGRAASTACRPRCRNWTRTSRSGRCHRRLRRRRPCWPGPIRPRRTPVRQSVPSLN